jgi:hypothetical protein
MGVLAAGIQQEKSRKLSQRSVALLCAGVVYAIVVAAAASRHEPWADEAQSWLLARDAGLADLWVRLLHYEGTPGLWQTLLHLFIRIGLPYSALNFVSGALGLAACALVLWRAPLPLAFRLTLPFTFFLFYQYAVVARSYALLPVLLFGAAILYGRGLRRVSALTVVLCLMAAISVHGMAFSFSIWLAFQLTLIRDLPRLTSPQRKRVLLAGIGYLATLTLLIAAAWPASDNMFVTRPNWHADHLVTVFGRALQNAFVGNWILSLAVIALSLPLLWRGRALMLFLISLASLSLINGIIYSQVWHYGLAFLAWVFAIWIAAARVKPGWMALASLGIVIGIQCYWTFETIAYDWKFPYSGSRDAALYLKQTGIPRQRLFAIGYACVGIQPYFPENIFANVNGGNPPAYWDWSVRNHVNEDSDRLAVRVPDYVIVGYKGTYEKELWTGQILRSGYQPVRHFEGNTFWRTAIFEPESFDLYRRPAR